MFPYRIYTLDEAGYIDRPPLDREFASDAGAIAAVKRTHVEVGVEVWCGARLVATIRCNRPRILAFDEASLELEAEPA